jgi:hypothetical protein
MEVVECYQPRRGVWKVAHGVSRGNRAEMAQAPEGRSIFRDANVCRPSRGLDVLWILLHGFAVGYLLSPLRGWPFPLWRCFAFLAGNSRSSFSAAGKQNGRKSISCVAVVLRLQPGAGAGREVTHVRLNAQAGQEFGLDFTLDALDATDGVAEQFVG